MCVKIVSKKCSSFNSLELGKSARNSVKITNVAGSGIDFENALSKAQFLEIVDFNRAGMDGVKKNVATGDSTLINSFGKFYEISNRVWANQGSGHRITPSLSTLIEAIRKKF